MCLTASNLLQTAHVFVLSRPRQTLAVSYGRLVLCSLLTRIVTFLSEIVHVEGLVRLLEHFEIVLIIPLEFVIKLILLRLLLARAQLLILLCSPFLIVVLLL